MKTTYSYDTFPTPLGDFSVALDGEGAVAASAFGGEAVLRRRLASDALVRDSHRVSAARAEVTEFLNGARRRFSLKLAPKGTAFQKRVWSALEGIAYGKTRSYGAVAAELGSRNLARAVGRASATNPISLLVPCHRVVGADGSLTGYAYGEDLKRWLLELESGRSNDRCGGRVG